MSGMSYPNSLGPLWEMRGEGERLWRCPGCAFEVLSAEQPEPCRDHPFSEMTEMGAA